MAQSNGNPTTEEIIDNLEDMLNDRISQEPTAPQVFPQSVSLPVMAHMQAPTAPSPTPAEAYIRIIEEPAERVTRFRYKCEDRFATPIAGKNSDAQKCKTYPTIEIVGYHGKKVVVVSCVTREKPYRQHPHWLVSKDDSNLCKKGVYRIMLPPEQNTLELQKVGIQCVKKNEVLSSLTERQNMKVDPFKAKFDHKNDIASINMYELRLCYQVFLPDAKNDFRIPLNPVVSSPIIGKSKEPLIARLCSCAAKVTGGDEIIMLCENINKNDIRVRFFETNEQNDVIWEADAEFQKTDIYKQMAIAFRTPRYRDPDVTHSVFVYLQLVRPTDMATSDPVAFEYYPNPGMLTFARLQRKLKRKQDLDIFQQILSLDSETTATKYSCPPLDLNEDENNTVSSDDSASKQQSSGTLNEFEIAVRKLQTDYEVNEGDATEYGDAMDNDNDMEIELEVPQMLPQLADDCTQTSTPMEDILKHPQLEPRPLCNVDKINEWMRSSEFERTDSLTVENGDTVSLSTATAQTAFTNVSSLTANTTITNNLEEEGREAPTSRRDTLENSAVKDLPIGGESELNDLLEDLPPSASAQASVDMDENFDDNATYTSLQIAFNNPIAIPNETQSVAVPLPVFDQLDEAELVVLTNPPAPKIKVNAAQTPATPPSPPLPLPPRTPSPDPEYKLPPLPPKPRHSQDLSVSVSDHSPSNSMSISRSRNGSVSSTRTTPSPIVIMRTPDQSPTKRQATSSSTPTASPKKRQGFFSRLFSRRKSRTDDESSQGSPSKQQSGSRLGSRATTPTGSREPSIAHFSLGDPNRCSARSTKSMQPQSNSNSLGLSPQNSTNASRSGKPVGRSSSSVSGKRPTHLNADVIHIPLKGGDSENSLLHPESYSNASTLTYGRPLDRKTLSTLQLADIPISDGNMELVAIADRQSIKNLCEGAYGVVLDPSVDLSEAEHFALYTSKSPEPPVGDGERGDVDVVEFLSPDEIARRLAEANGLQ
ncbi:embryonic polarity protein dorsal isoform X1 [Scaptodrosophila lebanonensis]|uniref:Embryonic polarity protein dorsal isoform X1 n=1 Tax=Drosophila lebanonensis TaxID=7225 RepID=A0A6J2U2V9_DROLE|nr:embryonic polarity protein dorsal isoform X1 [Scaptodrosophila lebanonensis]XP_030382982.1 embryonic polarity protein dorsal isoform X1 [Scaptodrosophila lebanonensis]